MNLLAMAEISKRYRLPDGTSKRVISHFNLTVDAGEVVWLRGRSGSGKSTVLNIAGLLTTPEAGSLRIDGHEVATANERTAAQLRRTSIGMVFQQSNLLPELTSAENIAIASARRLSPGQITSHLNEFGLGPFADQKAKQLSGGQQQRVAFCRALINEPRLLLADEPNSGLDDINTEGIRAALLAAAARGCAILLASHSNAFADIASRAVIMDDTCDAAASARTDRQP